MLIDEQGKALGVVTFDQAMWLAWDTGLDVVEVGAQAQPPVARLLDYGKYQYEQAKAESKSKAHAPEIKEIRLTLKIGQHDFDVKRGQAERWLAEGDRVRITVTLYGREMMFAYQANDMIERMRGTLDAAIETPIQKMGKRISVIVGRKK